MATKRDPFLRAMTDRSMVAYLCGRRMFDAGLDWAPGLVDGGPALDTWMTAHEINARQQLMPASWVTAWHRGWNDAAADEAAENGAQPCP